MWTLPACSECRDTSAAKLLLVSLKVSCLEFDPRTAKGLLIVDGATSDLRGSKLGELDAEPTSVVERDQEDRVGKPKVSFANVATQHILEIMT